MSASVAMNAELQIPAGTVTLDGNLAVPEGALKIVLFAHGSGSSRYSPRNQFVAGAFNQVGLATLLFDLLTPEEETEDVHTGNTASISHCWPCDLATQPNGHSARSQLSICESATLAPALVEVQHW